MTVLVPHAEGEAALADIDGLELVRYDEQAEELPEAAQRAAVLIPGFLATSDALKLVERCPALRLVQLLSAGAEMWVGRLPEGVQLSDCQGAHGGVTAEWVLATTLAVLREIPPFVRAQDEARWDQHITDTLTGKRVLLVGAGDLAEQTARRLETFDVAAITRVGRRARDGVHATSELPDLLPDHDVVVLLVPLTDETRGLVDAAFLAAMPDGALLVSRPGAGEVVRLVAGPGGTTSTTLVGDLTQPHGLWFSGSTLYVAESDAVRSYPYADGRLGTPTTVVDGLPDARSPDLRGAYAHALKSVAVGPDGAIYISVGSTGNVSPQDRESTPQRAAILRVPPGGGPVVVDRDETVRLLLLLLQLALVLFTALSALPSRKRLDQQPGVGGAL